MTVERVELTCVSIRKRSEVAKQPTFYFNKLSESIVKGNAQFVLTKTFEPLMDFKQNHCESWRYYKSC